MGLLAILTGKKSDHTSPAHNARPKSLYRGVQIIAANQGCCRAAKTLAGQRFLADEIPKLPLEHCDAYQCQCRYKLYNDRRTSERRLSDFGHDIVSQLRTDDNQRGDAGDRRGAAILSPLTSTFR